MSSDDFEFGKLQQKLLLADRRKNTVAFSLEPILQAQRLAFSNFACITVSPTPTMALGLFASVDGLLERWGRRRSL